MSLITISEAQKKIVKYTRERRLGMGLTQNGLAMRAGVSLSSLRKFEQQGSISLESFLKLMLTLNSLEELVNAVKPNQASYLSIDDVLKDNKKRKLKKGWRT